MFGKWGNAWKDGKAVGARYECKEAEYIFVL